MLECKFVFTRNLFSRQKICVIRWRTRHGTNLKLFIIRAWFFAHFILFNVFHLPPNDGNSIAGVISSKEIANDSAAECLSAEALNIYVWVITFKLGLGVRSYVRKVWSAITITSIHRPCWVPLPSYRHYLQAWDLKTFSSPKQARRKTSHTQDVAKQTLCNQKHYPIKFYASKQLLHSTNFE